MNKDFRDLRIVFMGTPDFAVASLRALVEHSCNIVGVVTAPDKPAGRGMKLTESAVKKYALEQSLTILQPEKLKNSEFIEALRGLKADLQVVVAFRMLPEIVWNMPPMGTLNVHGSLLPDYRGAAPINRAVMNGEKETGVTTFKLKHEIDTGDILLRERMPIGENETATEVHDRMKEIGAQLLVKTIVAIANGTIEEQPQIPNSETKHAPKIFTQDCQINVYDNCNAIYNQIRGLADFPGAFTTFHNKTIKLFKSTIELSDDKEVPGEWISDGKTFLKFRCADGYIHAHLLQLEGKKKMLVEDFLRGYKF